MANDAFSFYPFSFAGLTGEYADYKSARFVVVPVPYDATTSYMAGARRGPYAVIESSIQLELFDDETGREPYTHGIHTFPALEPLVHPERMLVSIRSCLNALLDDGKFPVVIGGDHSISLAPVAAFRDRGYRFTVLHLDAHADLRAEYQGTRHSHACTMRRIAELPVPVVQAGIRSMSKEEFDFARGTTSIKTFYARDIYDRYDFTDIVAALPTDDVYVTVDVDVFDPSVIPATGTPEPGGLNWYQVTGLLRQVAAAKKIIGFDVVELAPVLPSQSEFTIAKLIYKLIGYITQKGER